MASPNQKATWLSRKLFETANELVPATPRRQLADGRWSKPSVASVLAEACEIGLAELRRRVEERRRAAASAALPPTLVLCVRCGLDCDCDKDSNEAGTKQDEARACEHGDHPAPVGERFCSDACLRCEHESEDGCDGLCEELARG